MLQHKESLLHLLSNKIALEPRIATVVFEEVQKHCRIQTVKGTADDSDNKYTPYYDFQGHLSTLRDHQVLAIRRGVNQKAIKMNYDINGDKVKGCIKYHLFNLAPKSLTKRRDLCEEVISDVWTRLLRRRATTRLWSDKCKAAQERACEVFESNLHRALLAPPLSPPTPVLALDPGFQAGIKCAVLDTDGNVIKLETVKFLGNLRERGSKTLTELLSDVKSMPSDDNKQVIVALGNGHGSQESRDLIQEVAKNTNTQIKVQLVNEAGASVWSVTEAAKIEFPKESAASIASISIGRRLQNPLHELVKVPPRSLGLGMYQHDLSEKELDEKLHLVSVDAVATVGVDINSCSVEILQKVPGMIKLAVKVIKSRPLKERKDLLKVSGLGPKTFENCAAFCRVSGREQLDATLVHPESYDLARWLLNKFCWDLSTTPPKNLPPKKEWSTKWESQVQKAAEKFGVSHGRVLSVIENLIDSMSKTDPRLKDAKENMNSNLGSIEGCMILPQDLADVSKLKNACPVRGIIGTIRNIADFGAFIDFGGHNDGLLHTSKLGPLNLRNLLIGQEIGIDILNVDGAKVSLGITGLDQNHHEARKGDREYAKGGTNRIKTGARSMSSGASSSKSQGYTKSRNDRKATGARTMSSSATSSKSQGYSKMRKDRTETGPRTVSSSATSRKEQKRKADENTALPKRAPPTNVNSNKKRKIR